MLPSSSQEKRKSQQKPMTFSSYESQRDKGQLTNKKTLDCAKREQQISDLYERGSVQDFLDTLQVQLDLWGVDVVKYFFHGHVGDSMNCYLLLLRLPKASRKHPPGGEGSVMLLLLCYGSVGSIWRPSDDKMTCSNDPILKSAKYFLLSLQMSSHYVLETV